MSSADFNDITTGNNGFAAGPGYDLVTGRGTPKAALVVNDLIGAFRSPRARRPTARRSARRRPILRSHFRRLTHEQRRRQRFLVNGIAADSFTLTNSTTITFHYDASPVVSQGLQSMSIAAGAISRQADGAPLAAFSASFRYDVLPIAVTSHDAVQRLDGHSAAVDTRVISTRPMRPRASAQAI